MDTTKGWRSDMSNRCPTARKVGTSIIRDYRLMFKGSVSENHFTIEGVNGHAVPVGIFSLMKMTRHHWIDMKNIRPLIIKKA